MSVKEQRGSHFAAFGGKDVVGPTGRLQVHDFEADAGRGKRPEQGARWEAQMFAGTEQDDFSAQSEEYRHVSFGQRGRGGGGPLGNDLLRQQNQVFFVFFVVDRDISVTVGGEQVESGGVGHVKFHWATAPKRPPKLRCTMR